MKWRNVKRAYRTSERTAFNMCRKKRKLKSSEASRLADKFNQRKYECPICGHWHLTNELRGKGG